MAPCLLNSRDYPGTRIFAPPERKQPSGTLSAVSHAVAARIIFARALSAVAASGPTGRSRGARKTTTRSCMEGQQNANFTPFLPHRSPLVLGPPRQTRLPLLTLALPSLFHDPQL